MDETDIHSAKVDTLVLGADTVDVDEKGKELVLEGTQDSNVHLEFHDVGRGRIDQSDSSIHVKGRGKYNVLNKFEDCDDIEVDQDGAFCLTEASENSRFNAVNHVKRVKNYKQTVKNSVIVVDGRKTSGKGGITAHTVIGKGRTVSGGITAHTVIGEGTVANITFKNTTTIVRS